MGGTPSPKSLVPVRPIDLGPQLAMAINISTSLLESVDILFHDGKRTTIGYPKLGLRNYTNFGRCVVSRGTIAKDWVALKLHSDSPFRLMKNGSFRPLNDFVRSSLCPQLPYLHQKVIEHSKLEIVNVLFRMLRGDRPLLTNLGLMELL
ncbi:hypothetical protein PAAG_11286 [Paracoccidioides lutzii Pb01]|uniref:Uncharacterized protein n=1 Tax=Paracoccidioides lutzii (strain ATCC MYA-826 / Pb01) TaxID=502779 RepID=A0A0A2V265_PARBA|nr:hypothetical protein PAAG_11286 [Paracoccidioides lutzii Pb01]KGQ01896.1 hypothetical protein PAAG_11286 [Paracoccidioides lutzii Pb01]